MKNALLILYILIPFAFLAQNNAERNVQKIDSLKKKTNLTNPTQKDFANIRAIRELYSQSNLDSSLHYSSIELDLARKSENPITIGQARLIKASVHNKLQQADIAYELLTENLKDKEVISEIVYAESLFWLAQVEVQKKLFSESIKHVIEASELYEAQNDSVMSSQCFSFIAGINTFVLGEPQEAIPYFEKALDYNASKDEQNAIRIYINYSSALEGVSKVDEALQKLRKAERIAKRPNNKIFLPSVYVQFASIYTNTERFDLSLEYTIKADSLIQEIPNYGRRTYQKIQWHYALNYKGLKDYPKAIYYFEMLKDVQVLDPWEARQHLIDIYKETKEFEKAFFLQEELIAGKDSINEVSRYENAKEITERYENEKSKQEILTLNAQKELQQSEIRTQQFIIYGVSGFFLILITLVFFWYRTRIKLKETSLNLKTSQLQQRFLRTQLNPHFLFHALTSIENYIYKNDSASSAGFLRSFSVLMRNILEFSDVDLIPLKSDITFIEKYIELQHLNHANRFDYEIIVSPELKLEEVKIPPMLIQPAVENAILHGALNANNAKVSIEYTLKDDLVQIVVKNNGEPSESKRRSSKKLNRSMSSDITQTRIDNFKEIHGIQLNYAPFDSLESSSESKVVFEIPLHLK